MDEKTTKESNRILKSYLNEMLTGKGLHKADVIRDAVLIFGIERGVSFIDINELIYEMGAVVLE